MSRPKPNRTVLDLGAVALPALCCLLAGIIWVAATSGGADQEPLPSDFAEQLERTEGATDQVGGRCDEFATHLERFEQEFAATSRARSQLLALAQLIAGARQQIAELLKTKGELDEQVDRHEQRRAQIADLSDQTKRVLAENEGARRRIAGLEATARKAASEPHIPGVSYRGPYVLVECGSGGAVVYPGRRTLGKDPSRDDLAWLLAEAERVGFVALAVRPDAFLTTFVPYYVGVVKHLDEAEAKGKKVGFAYFPLQSAEPIAPYVPKGASR